MFKRKGPHVHISCWRSPLLANTFRFSSAKEDDQDLQEVPKPGKGEVVVQDATLVELCLQRAVSSTSCHTSSNEGGGRRTSGLSPMYKLLKHGKHVCKKGNDERDMFLMSKPAMYFKSHCRPPVSAPLDALHNRAGNSPPGGKVELERSNMAINGLPDTNSVCK